MVQDARIKWIDRPRQSLMPTWESTHAAALVISSSNHQVVLMIKMLIVPMLEKNQPSTNFFNAEVKPVKIASLGEHNS